MRLFQTTAHVKVILSMPPQQSAEMHRFRTIQISNNCTLKHNVSSLLFLTIVQSYMLFSDSRTSLQVHLEFFPTDCVPIGGGRDSGHSDPWCTMNASAALLLSLGFSSTTIAFR